MNDWMTAKYTLIWFWHWLHFFFLRAINFLHFLLSFYVLFAFSVSFFVCHGFPIFEFFIHLWKCSPKKKTHTMQWKFSTESISSHRTINIEHRTLRPKGEYDYCGHTTPSLLAHFTMEIFIVPFNFLVRRFLKNSLLSFIIIFGKIILKFLRLAFCMRYTLVECSNNTYTVVHDFHCAFLYGSNGFACKMF